MIRVVIRKPLHPYIQETAKALGVQDFGEVVNWLILQHKLASKEPTHTYATHTNNDDLDELQGLL